MHQPMRVQQRRRTSQSEAGKPFLIDQSKSMLFVIYSISILLARGMMTHSMSNSSRETQKWQPLDGNVVQIVLYNVL